MITTITRGLKTGVDHRELMIKYTNCRYETFAEIDKIKSTYSCNNNVLSDTI